MQCQVSYAICTAIDAGLNIGCKYKSVAWWVIQRNGRDKNSTYSKLASLVIESYVCYMHWIFRRGNFNAIGPRGTKDTPYERR